MKPYVQHSGKVLEATGDFKHVMAISLDPRSGYTNGIARCIVSREGDLTVRGYVDRSELRVISKDGPEHFKVGEQLYIAGSEGVLAQLQDKSTDFIGLEDPDIWIDPVTNLMHVYFTMPFLNKEKSGAFIHLGHAVGKDLNSLKMTMPVLREDSTHEAAKEVSIAPANSKGVRLNLFESGKKEADFDYSVVNVAIAKDVNGPWEYGDIVFHPKEHGIPWIGGHASPGPLLPKSFIDVGPNKLVGLLNGREANRRVGGNIEYGIFSVGLCIYDYELGKIDWVSPEPFIRDTEAKTITFASQFIESSAGEGTLYAHVDDSFVRAYTLNGAAINKLLPKHI